MTFEQDKQKQLSKSDRSSIGSWDSKIKGLCEKINKNKKYYTTSSCAGRVVIIKALEEKAEDVFLFRTHDKISFNELKKALGVAGEKYKELVEFQQTTCILHVACESLKDAQEIVNKAKLAGWKRSGIMGGKRNMVELHSTESISFPIMNNGKVLVDDDFLKLIVKQANSKLERTWEKIQRLNQLI
ncbi:MAG: tRNA wybutosine-synthesizing 3 family protein [Candidatus Pacearchaeota archaeon]|jgi:tRNA wybutosine-synthesizing protein 3